MMLGCTLSVVRFAVAILALAVSGCTFPNDMNRKFPDFAVTEQMDVFALDVIPERKICSIEGSNNSKEFIAVLSKRYPHSWHRPARVSLAPSYRIVAGTTEILILKLGIAVSTKTGSRKEMLVHDLRPGEAEEIMRAACKNAKSTE